MRISDRRRERGEAEATLTAVDAALESGHPDVGEERERQLGRLAVTLRGGAPEPSPAFAAELERRVQEGFARNGATPEAASAQGQRAARPREGRAWLPRPGLRPLGVVAASLLVLALGGGLLAGAGLLEGGGRGGMDDGSGTPEPSTPGAPEGRGGATPLVSPSPSSPPAADESLSRDEGFAPGERDRRVERTASLTLEAPDDRLDSVADGIVAVTDRHRGYVVSSFTSSGEETPAGGSFEVRVPVDELRAAMTDLAALATVRSQSATGEDLTQAVASTSDRLAGARAQRRGLLRRLETADTDRQASALRRQIDLVSGEIRGLRSQLRALEERTDYARISVLLRGEDAASAGGRWSTGDALEDALGSMVGALNLAVRALGVLVPLALLGGLAWLSVATLRRRRREAALG